MKGIEHTEQMFKYKNMIDFENVDFGINFNDIDIGIDFEDIDMRY